MTDSIAAVPALIGTSLRIAAYNGHHNLCKLLLSANADVSAGDYCTGDDTWKKRFETLHILVEGRAVEEFSGNNHFLEKPDMPEDMFSYILHHTFLNEPLFAEKCSIATSMLKCSKIQRRIRMLLGGSKFSVYARLHNNEEALKEFFQILCLNVLVFRNQKMKKRFSKGTIFPIYEHELEELLRELIGAQVPLHETGYDELTLLKRIVRACMFQRGTNHRGRQILDWIKILQASGIDLEQYGRKEHPIFKMKKRNNFESLVFMSRINRVEAANHEGPMKPVINFELGWSSLIGFDYGPCVEDWKFWFSEPTDRFAGDFWSLIEDPSLMNLVPGAWVDKLLYAYSKTYQNPLLDALFTGENHDTEPTVIFNSSSADENNVGKAAVRG
ncbi:hypothetical protein BOTNAR_0088g00210 [Botryotinia narcissicola]|uniref:Uncharacterized protein n=1 Tax=Botryotinia narcissicola TaxID=278944 RepID=A0A4Z1ISM4_9HELO|nr:hypothetical protein BOTNAR_0088g00210 [Botryotinia narcissicola]